jgi:hypothetical protein
MPKWIEPAEALRVLLRARHPAYATIAGEITSYDWFWHWKSREVPADVHAAADATIKELCRHIKEGGVRLRGDLHSDQPPADIDPTDCGGGELDVFAGTLTIEDARIYRRVHCNAEDVTHIVEPAPADPLSSSAGKDKRGRKPHDWQAIEARVHALMDHHGNFSVDDPDWNCRARLEGKIIDEFNIGRTQLAERLPAMLDRWRAGKSGN